MNLKSVKKLALSLCLFLMVFTKVINAECDYKLQNEINAAAANVKAQYELKQVVADMEGNERPDLPLEMGMGGQGREPYYIKKEIKLKVYNITDKIYIEFSNDQEGISEIYHANDLTDSTFTYDVPDIEQIREYKIKIYSENSGCGGELRTIDIKTPKYNSYSALMACQDNDKYYCKEFITEELPENMLQEIAENYEKKEEENEKQNEQQNNMVIPIVIVVGIIILIIAAIYMKKKIDESKI